MKLNVQEITMEFKAVHNAYIHSWEQAMQTGITTEVERVYSDKYYDVFLSGAQDDFIREGRKSAMEGLRSSVATLQGASKRFENRIIRVRKNGTVVVFYEQVVQRNEGKLARLFVIEDWAHYQNGWRIVREVTESI